MSLALFPLNTVLFPGCTLDLQIFEARYLDMISRCMKQGSGFGVVCILDGEEVGQAPQGFALIGCEALIRDFQQQDNGLLGIRVEGGRRFRVLDSTLQKDQLIVAEDRRRGRVAGRDSRAAVAGGGRGSGGLAQGVGRAPDGRRPGHGQRSLRAAVAGESGSSRWRINCRICCPFPMRTRLICWNSTTRSSGWMPSRRCSTSCRVSCSPESVPMAVG